jgi:transcriptional regulator with XRE-family HTH domain
MNRYKIRSDIIYQLRRSFNLTQEDLKKRTRLSKKTISNLEAGRDKQKINLVNKHTKDRLVSTLSVDERVLSGEQSIPERPASKSVSVELSPEVELNYDLICRRYRISRQEIYNVAPLLFLLAAEKALDLEMESIEASLVENISDEHLEQAKEKFEAHAKADIFNLTIPSNSLGPFTENPFADFLEKEILKPRYRSLVDFSDRYGRLFHGYTNYTFSDVIPAYLVCKDLLDEVTRGSAIAKKALLDGKVKLDEIPDKLLQPNKSSERIAWIEQQGVRVNETPT